MTIWGKIPYHPIAFKKELKIISQYWWYIFLNCHSIRLALLNRLPNMDCAKEYVLQKLILKEMCHAYMFQLQYICILPVSRLFVENPTCSKPKRQNFFTVEKSIYISLKMHDIFTQINANVVQKQHSYLLQKQMLADILYYRVISNITI